MLTDYLEIIFRMRHSFSTCRSSKNWTAKLDLRSTVWHMGQGAAPPPNILSTQDTHLAIKGIVSMTAALVINGDSAERGENDGSYTGVYIMW